MNVPHFSTFSQLIHLTPNPGKRSGLSAFPPMCAILGHSKVPRFSLPLIFPFANPLEDGKPGLLRIGYRDLLRRVERRKHFTNRLLTSRAMGQRFSRQRAAQNELSTAYLAVTFAEFVFVQWHGNKPNREIHEAHERIVRQGFSCIWWSMVTNVMHQDGRCTMVT